jgi:phosphoribosyl 1,2-cyclic phosphate phosphodiesterase
MATLALEVLGSGGAVRTPRPGHHDLVDEGARLHGVPWQRTGPSVFVHGPNVLIDTSEDIYFQLERSQVKQIDAGFYSHWHPDHTAGRRVWETMNADFLNQPAHPRTTPIYLPPNVRHSFAERGLAEHFAFLAARQWVTLHDFDGPLELAGWRITAHELYEAYVYAFLFEEIAPAAGGKPRRALICMDELFGWVPPAALCGVDLAYIPMGIPEFHPLTGERLVAADHVVWQAEASYVDSLAIAERLQAGKLIFGHIEGPFGLTPDQLAEMAENLQRERGWDVTFAYDTLMVELGA